MRTFAIRIARTLEAISGFALLLMVGVILMQVVLRYGFSEGMIWGEEFARIMMIAAALLGAAVAHWQGKHIRFDLIEQALPARPRRAMAFVAELIVLGTTVVLAASGWRLATENAMQDSLTLDVSMLYIYALLPLGFGWMVAASLGRLCLLLCDLPDGSASVSGPPR